MPPLDLTALLGAGGQAQAPAEAPLLTGGETSPLGTVLARLRTTGGGFGKGVMRGMGGPARAPAPSRGGAIAQGVMQAMDANAAQDKADKEAQRLAALFGYNKQKDERDFAYKVAKDKESAAETKRWHDLYKSPKATTKDPLDLEKKRLDVFSKDPLFLKQQADDEAAGSRKLSPESRAALDSQVEARRKAIWTMGGGTADDEDAPAPKPSDVTPDPTPDPAATIPLPTPRPEELTTRPEIDESGEPITGIPPAPAAPAAPAATGFAPPPNGQPMKIRNRATGEIRVWNGKGGYDPMPTAPADPAEAPTGD